MLFSRGRLHWHDVRRDCHHPPYTDDIVLLARFKSDLDKQLRIIKDLCSTMGMIINIDKTKVILIKSNKVTYDPFLYDNNNLEGVTSYKYLGINIHHKLN